MYLSQACFSLMCISQACTLWAWLSSGHDLRGPHLIGVSLLRTCISETRLFLAGMHLRDVHLRGLSLARTCISEISETCFSWAWLSRGHASHRHASHRLVSRVRIWHSIGGCRKLAWENFDFG